MKHALGWTIMVGLILVVDGTYAIWMGQSLQVLIRSLGFDMAALLLIYSWFTLQDRIEKIETTLFELETNVSFLKADLTAMSDRPHT